MRRPVILVIDDESLIGEAIAAALEDGYQVVAFEAAEPALAALGRMAPDLVLLDIGLPGMGGLEALARIRRHDANLPVVMITADRDISTVVAAVKQGAWDYITKPLKMDALTRAIDNALATVRLRRDVQALQARYLEEHIPCFIGESDTIQAVMAFVGRVAQSPDTPVLILGETGTGKELIAGAIHYQSPNFKGPFTAVNCAAIPTELIESELFGYEKGAFSGAAQTKPGLIEAAAGGTLFLDEIGDLNAAAQAKLLRFLETGEFYRVGGTQRHTIRTRVVSATNQDLDALMADGRFRRDLYFRLGVIRVTVPALNARSGDILPLARHFIEVFNQKFGKWVRDLGPGAVQALEGHAWTGNVRELRNVIERAVLLAEGEHIEVDMLGLTPPTALETGFAPLPDEGMDLAAALAAMERFYIHEALRRTDGNESRAARLLGLNHHTFRYQRKKLAV
ncbi:MAG: sigma-54 dependent transcriptional regulator [Desulfobacterales bacterium]|jgi:DNA-binding NtrC family response regulator|nr:sigma-54 dependent transcriptional regulator [Desulfobacteraceae bacterium]MDD3993475.1 sigma-54 dependent transcriptional regulator [Desulfobacteraceae bacterium]MDY0312738.1 sigma-54 dependent transcriptional regulator [Desulfobacterales bacterium]